MTTIVPEITPLELAHALEAGEAVQVVDIRAPARVAAGRIELAPEDRFHNLVGSQLIRQSSLDAAGLDPTLPVAVVCARGNDSKILTQHLNGLGAAARSLRGGMTAWMRLVLPRRLGPTPTLDHLVQLDRVGKGALGYLLVSDAQALVVDPPLDAQAYLVELETLGAELVAVADTHVHADYVSGGPALARQQGVPYYLHPADAVYPYDGTPGRIAYEPLADGQELTLGRCRIRVTHTPGHTEGSVTFLVDGQAALTGDFLFVASIGRPDLAGKTEAWTAALWESVQRARGDWPGELLICPAHYGAESERRPDRSVAAPLEAVRAQNAALKFGAFEEFADWVRRNQSSFPEAYRTIKAINVGLLPPDPEAVEVLEIGKNECALRSA